MSRSHKDNNGEVRVELKYCEHCGGLHVRERGSEVVYCGKCQGKVADLPIPKKKPGKVTLAQVRRGSGENRVAITPEQLRDMEAVGGVA